MATQYLDRLALQALLTHFQNCLQKLKRMSLLMNLAETIYQKSLTLSSEKAQTVIDFINLIHDRCQNFLVNCQEPLTQAMTPTDPSVAALQESVRHNEKNIDKLDRDLKDFRLEVLTQFEKVEQQFDRVNDRFNQLETKVNDRFNQITMLLIAIVSLVVALLVKLSFLIEF